MLNSCALLVQQPWNPLPCMWESKMSANVAPDICQNFFFPASFLESFQKIPTWAHVRRFRKINGSTNRLNVPELFLRLWTWPTWIFFADLHSASPIVALVPAFLLSYGKQLWGVVCYLAYWHQTGIDPPVSLSESKWAIPLTAIVLQWCKFLFIPL